HLKALLKASLPDLKIRTKVYPRYETRGDLNACVARFREWLVNEVIDLEVKAGTPSAAVDPSVRVILVAHSMGGIVAADTLLSVVDDETISGHHESFMFPYVQGILAFDTPYLGLAPGMFAHNADSKIKAASSVFNQFSSLTSGFLATKAAEETVNATKKDQKQAGDKWNSQAVIKKEAPVKKETPAAAGSWGNWAQLATYAGAATVALAGGAALYYKRQEIGEGYNWVSSHLEFVGALMKTEELRARLKRASSVPGVGFADFYTSLGKRESEGGVGFATTFWEGERTFCSVPDPKEREHKFFYKWVNEKAVDEVGAHCSLFDKKTNPKFEEMSDNARKLIVQWTLAGGWTQTNLDLD
ncbi:hypothetical protein RUND412_011619, partial [Rhizina undulata]